MNSLTLISIILSILIFVSPFLINKFRKNPFSSNELQSMVTTFGILGTFIGIIVGLLGFDVTNIYGSVPQLLEGLKTAFLTSISGMSAAILLKLNPKIYGIHKSNKDSDLTFAESMLNSLNGINTRLDKIHNEHYLQLKNIENALTGEGETTLVTQIQKLRTLISDKTDDLLVEFREFAKNMAENNSKALIDALTQVMRDFNTKINEQFGDNFKQLNQAVERILIWQENYKEQIELMLRQFENSIKIVENSEKALSRIGDEMKELTTVNEKLKDLIILFHNEIETINKIAENAKNAFPIIEENITKLTSDFSQKVSDATDELYKISKIQQEKIAFEINHIHEVAENIIDNFSELTKEFSQKVSITIDELGSISKVQDETIKEQIRKVSEITKTMNDNVNKILQDLNGQINLFMKKNAERINKQISELDKELEKELNQALKAIANQLAALSSKFAEDYTPITENLKKILDSFRLER